MTTSTSGSLSSSSRPARVGIVGAGYISTEYLRTLNSSTDVQVCFVADRHVERAGARAEEFGIPASGSYEVMLADPEVDIVVNLTVPQAHAAVTRQALEAGKHVYSEKPLALTLEDGRHLLELAESRGLRLACAPDTFLGQGLQTALRAVRARIVGEPRAVFLNFQYGGPDLWHPNPEFLFQEGAGPLLDMGPYYLTLAVQIFGPVSRVVAQASTGSSTRTIRTGPRAGRKFPVQVPTHVAALLEFATGATAQAVFSFDNPITRMAVEIVGSDGALTPPDPNQFTGESRVFSRDGTSSVIDPSGPGASARGGGVIDLVQALRSGERERADAHLALHVLEVMLATAEAARTGKAVAIGSRVLPAPLLPEGRSTPSSLRAG